MLKPPPNLTVRIILKSLQETNKQHYQTLIKEAKLTRYLDNLPPEDFNSGATGEELASLFKVTNDLQGDGLFRLFLRTFSGATTKGILRSPWGEMMRGKVKSIPVKERVDWFIKEWSTLADQTWSPTILTEKEHAWYQSSPECPICSYIKDKDSPVCLPIELNTKGLAQEIIGKQLRVKEIECKATGADACVIEIYK